jgi:hypothetical protein
MWTQLLQPNLVLGKPVIYLSADILKQHYLRGLILDVDETLVPLRSREASEELIAWIHEIRQVANIWLVSNNLSQSRIGSIADSLDLPYILGARKPSRKRLREAAEGMQLPVQEIAMVGDRIFTDVLAGNRLQMFTILVEPMVDPAVVERSYPIRRIEVQISQWLGVSISHQNQGSPQPNKPSSG